MEPIKQVEKEKSDTRKDFEEQIKKSMEEQKIKENSMTVGEGEDNWSYMPDGFTERRDLEQYFFTENNIDQFIFTLNMTYPDPEEMEAKVCLIGAPTLAKALYEQYDIKVTILDIDKRFEDLPGFKYFDLKEPYEIEDKEFDFIFIDPPFFSVTLDEQAHAITVVAKENFNGKVLISFPWKEERQLKKSFKDFGLERTGFELQYATVQPARWENYILYSNYDLPGIKRLKR